MMQGLETSKAATFRLQIKAKNASNLLDKKAICAIYLLANCTAYKVKCQDWLRI